MKNQKTYFSSLDTITTTYSRIFCRKVIPLFTKEASKGEKDSSTDGWKKFFMIKNFFKREQRLFSSFKIRDPGNYFSGKNTNACSSNMRFIKNTQHFLYKKWETWFRFFIQKNFANGSRGDYRCFKPEKELSKKWHPY